MTTDKDRIQTLEHECARLEEQNAMLWERCRLMSNRERRMVDAIANDAYAATFQTMGQYRTALLKMLRGEMADAMLAAREVKHD